MERFARKMSFLFVLKLTKKIREECEAGKKEQIRAGIIRRKTPFVLDQMNLCNLDFNGGTSVTISAG